jgi:hypothetical protein
MKRCLLFLVTLTLGCGGRSAGLELDAGAGQSLEAGHGSDTGRGSNGDMWPRRDSGAVRPDLSLPPSACVIAIRVDSCCTQPMPAFVSNLLQDPCLVPYPPKVIPAECKAKWTSNCDARACTWGRPLSRLVQALPGGSCNWKSECQTDADCVWAKDIRQCCTCGEAYPRSLVAQDLCLQAMPGTPPPAGTCPDPCLWDCGQPPCPATRASCVGTPYQQFPLMVCGTNWPSP